MPPLVQFFFLVPQLTQKRFNVVIKVKVEWLKEHQNFRLQPSLNGIQEEDISRGDIDVARVGYMSHEILL